MVSDKKPLKIWIVCPYGPLPGSGWREHRSVLKANALSARGHEVTRWIANYDHNGKTHYNFPGDRLEVSPNFTIRFLPVRGYESNVSLDRIRTEREFAQEFLRQGKSEPPPDLLIVVDPAALYVKEVLRFVRASGCRLLVDIYDLWPELFEIAVPKRFRSLNPIVFGALYRSRTKLFRAADAILAVCPSYLEVARNALGAPKKPMESIWIGVDVERVRNSDHRPIQAIFQRENTLKVIYAGSMGAHYDLASILEAARQIDAKDLPIEIVVAGHGPEKAAFETVISTEKLRCIRYLGKVDSDKLNEIYRQCDVGLCTYNAESTVSFPVKAFDYLAAGLAIVNSLGGDLADLLERTGAGVHYDGGNAASLIAVLEQFALDRAKLDSLKAAAFAAGSELDIKPLYERYVSFVEELMSVSGL